ncbi:hypothetical protein C5E05_19120 [Pseudoclavibacter sp. AY1H1]|nr:hypothetical protein C5E05_19120 [Pseudoclavibacter sp. AY1H1]
MAVELAPAPIAGGEKLPVVSLGSLGPDAALDACDGSFPQLASYAVDASLQPVYAAHNGCGGDVILPLDVGSRLVIEDTTGAAQTYQVTELRDVDKYTATTADVTGMSGALLLQTCHWGEPVMRFVALSPAV